MKMLKLAVILAALALPAAAQSTAKVETQSNVSAPTAKADAKATGKSATKSTKAHAKHKTHKKKPAPAST